MPEEVEEEDLCSRMRAAWQQSKLGAAARLQRKLETRHRFVNLNGNRL